MNLTFYRDFADQEGTRGSADDVDVLDVRPKPLDARILPRKLSVRIDGPFRVEINGGCVMLRLGPAASIRVTEEPS